MGASDFSSAPALHRKLAKQISFSSIINEFGELLGLLFDKLNMNMRTLRKMIVQFMKSRSGALRLALRRMPTLTRTLSNCFPRRCRYLPKVCPVRCMARLMNAP